MIRFRAPVSRQRTRQLSQVAYGPNAAADRARALPISAPRKYVEDTTGVDPRNAGRLVGQHWLYDRPLIVGEFIAPDSKPPFGSLNHRRKAWIHKLKIHGRMNLDTKPPASVYLPEACG
jgi:hypothetical protein